VIPCDEWCCNHSCYHLQLSMICDIKNTFDTAVYCAEYAFPILLFDSLLVLKSILYWGASERSRVNHQVTACAVVFPSGLCQCSSKQNG
jgi:hypothetical protein